MVYLEKNNLDELITSGKYLLDFYAEWCMPCKMLSSVLESIDDKINIIKINIDEFPDLASSYKVMSVPTLVFTVDGKKVHELIGYCDEEKLIEVIEEL